MGNQPTTEKPNEEVIKVINANVQQNAHLEKTANATTALSYVAFLLLGVGVAYLIFRAIIRHERLKTTRTVQNAVSLAAVTVLPR